jgi:hypothetical protein
MKTCNRQTTENRGRAKHVSLSPRKSSVSSSHLPNIQLPPPLSLNPGSSIFQRSPSYTQMLPPSLPQSRSCSPAVSVSSLPPLPSPYSNFTIPMAQSPLPSPSQPFPDYPISRSWSQSVLIDDTSVWSPERQKQFEERIARLTVSAGLPLSWVDNPEWIDFIRDFLPSARSPSRKTLTNRLIPAAAKSYQDMAKTAAQDQNVTLQADGWTGVNFHHLLAFMIAFNQQV